jgi:GAF domain-containing protein
LVQLPSAIDRSSGAVEAAVQREASLRRIATLVAGGVAAEELFSAVAREVSVVLDVPVVTVGRYELEDGSPVSVVLASREHASFPVGSRWPLDGEGTREVYEDRSPILIDDFSDLEGTFAEAAREQQMSWVVGAPIILDGSVWGNIYAGTAGDEPIPADVEAGLADFTDLVSTAIANSDAREQVGRLLDEQAALRRVATLVAKGTSAEELFALVSEEVAALFGAEAFIARFEPDAAAMVFVGLTDGNPVTIGTRLELSAPHASEAVLRTGRPARYDHASPLEDTSGRAGERPGVQPGICSTVAAPIVVEGKLWGVLALTDPRHRFPPDTEQRVGRFTDLVATSIADSQARDDLAQLADEQAALRRVAALVAGGASSTAVFDAVAQEVAQLFKFAPTLVARYEDDGATMTALAAHPPSSMLGSRWPLDGPSVAAEVLHSGRPVRMEDWADLPGTLAAVAREHGWTRVVGAPIIVDGRVWGLVSAVGPPDEPLPQNLEDRLAEFTELVATAIANSQTRDTLAELAEEQAALRRVATLVAEGAAADNLLAAVAREVAHLFDAEMVNIDRYENGESVVLASFEAFPVGSRWPLDGAGVRTMVYETGRPARVDDFTGVAGTAPAVARTMGIKSSLAVPIVVEGRLWGVMGLGRTQDLLLPSDTEQRLAAFTELVATAIANAESRRELASSEARARELAEEQAALRRVATLVAQGASADELFSGVAREVAGYMDVPVVGIHRYEGDRAVTTLGIAGETSFRVGARLPVTDGGIAAMMLATGRPSRIDDFTSVPRDAVREDLRLPMVGVPIVVEGRIWGFMVVVAARPGRGLPAGTEERLARFTELIATAIANNEAHVDLAASEARARELANEQAALRRVATLVAQGASPEELFSAVAEEVAGVIDAPVVGINRYEADGTYTIVGNAGESSRWIGTRWPVGTRDLTGMILATGRPSRQDDFIGIRGNLVASAGDAPTESWREKRSMVGVPIIVEGSIWGVMSAVAAPGMLVPPGTEERLARFTELVATAVSNATTRSDLLTSRARLVSAADESRRRLERDLHDGIQQWLVGLALRARRAAAFSKDAEPAARELSGLADDLVAVTDELREISQGIHPAILSEAGLDDALESLARRSAIRVDLEAGFGGRYDPAVEATIYYVVAESITNAVKHAQASVVTVRGRRRGGSLELEIADDGVGGADPARGTGLIGLKDRVDTLSGTISFASPAGGGTSIRVTLPARLAADSG